MNIEVLNNDTLQAGAREPCAPTGKLHEIFGDSRDGAVFGFALALAAETASAEKPILWVQDRMALIEGGLPYARGLARWNVPDGLIRVCARTGTDVLWAMEEGLTCAGLSAVIGEMWGASNALDFTATRRLCLRAERNGVPAYLIRIAAEPSLSAASERWRVHSLPSAPHPYDRKAPGDPRWAMEMFRARWRRPGVWQGRYDRAAHRLDLDTTAGPGALADDAGAGGRARTG